MKNGRCSDMSVGGVPFHHYFRDAGRTPEPVPAAAVAVGVAAVAAAGRYATVVPVAEVRRGAYAEPTR
jgi:hypothetical protein